MLYSSFFAHWPSFQGSNSPGSWLLGMESSLPRHFGTVNYYLTKKSLNVGLTDQPQDKKRRKNINGQLSTTKNEQRQHFDHIERKDLQQGYRQ